MFVGMFLCICNTKYENNVEKITIYKGRSKQGALFIFERRARIWPLKHFSIIITPESEHRKSGYVERKWRPHQSNVVRYA